MTRIICIASGKGGVGKTTLTANLAAALAQLNQNVIAIDANLTTSNLGLHLGIPMYPVTLQDVLKKKSRLKDAMYYHSAGFKVIPADMSIERIMTPRMHDLVDVFYRAVAGADFVLIDSAAGLGKEALAAVEAADEMIIVTNPDMPALTDALKLERMAERLGTRVIGVVINRTKKSRHDLKLDVIKSFLSVPVIGEIPEDHNVYRALAHKEPVIIHRPKSYASEHIKSLAAYLTGKEYKPRKNLGLFSWLRV